MLTAQRVSEIYKSTSSLKIRETPHQLDKYDSAGASTDKNSHKNFKDILLKEISKKDSRKIS